MKQSSSIPDNNTKSGSVPKSRTPKPPKHHFETANYSYADGGAINLPVRPDAPLAKRDEDRFRDIVKQIAIDLDASNNRFFIAYRHNIDKRGDWWQAGGNSVLFYHHYFEKQYELTPINLRPDNDYGCAWPKSTYIVMIKNIERMVAQLQAKANARVILDTPELIILEYPIQFPDGEIQSFRRSDSDRREHINKLLLPKVVHPHTYRSIIKLYRAIYDHFNHFSANQRCAFGLPMLQPIQSVTFDFISMSKGSIPPLEYYSDALIKIDELCAWLVTIQNFRIFTVDELYNIATLAEQVKGNIKNEILQLQTKSSE